jgi:hypothetical protein
VYLEEDYWIVLRSEYACHAYYKINHWRHMYSF